MPTLSSNPPWPPRNDSGIGHDVGKLSSETTFEFREVDGYKEHFADSDVEATRIFDVRWGQRLAWKDFVVGFSVVTVPPGGGGGGNIHGNPAALIARTIPWQ